MKVVRQTSERLELIHRPMFFMALFGLASGAYGVWLWLRAEDWKGYVGAGIGVVIGVVLLLTATNSRVVFDKASGWYEAHHRRLLGKTKVHREWLSSIEAVVLNRDATMGNVLVVICVRISGKDLPITMFGTPFPAGAYHQGLRIAAFLGLPLGEKDRIVVEDPQDQMAGLFTTLVAGPEKEGTVRAKWGQARKWGYFVWGLDLASVGFYGYLVLNRDDTAPVLGIEPAIWKMVLLAAGLFFITAMGLSARLCERYTGIVYVKDRKAFALAGGFDIGQWPMLATQLALYGVFWFTFTSMEPDPIARFRHWWVYVLASLVIGLILSRITAVIAFPAWARRHLGASRVRPKKPTPPVAGPSPVSTPVGGEGLPSFQSAAQRRVYEGVGVWLKELFGGSVVAPSEVPAFFLAQGQTMAAVAVHPWGDQDATVAVRSYVLQGTEPTADLMKHLLRQNDLLRFGAWGLDESGGVFLEHTIAGSTSSREKLRASVLAVLVTAERSRGELAGRWGT